MNVTESKIDFPVYALAPEIPALRYVSSAGEVAGLNTERQIDQVELKHKDCLGHPGWFLEVISYRISSFDADEIVITKLWLATQGKNPPRDPAEVEGWFRGLIDSCPRASDLPSVSIAIDVMDIPIPFNIFRIDETWVGAKNLYGQTVGLMGQGIEPQQVKLSLIENVDAINKVVQSGTAYRDEQPTHLWWP